MIANPLKIDIEPWNKRKENKKRVLEFRFVVVVAAFFYGFRSALPHHESYSRTTILREPWSMIARTLSTSHRHNELAHLFGQNEKSFVHRKICCFFLLFLLFFILLIQLYIFSVFRWSISTVVISSRSKHSLLQGNKAGKTESSTSYNKKSEKKKKRYTTDEKKGPRLASVSGLRELKPWLTMRVFSGLKITLVHV